MERSRIAQKRAFSFAIPAFMDGTLGLVQTALPLLAIRFGASAWFLGMLGWTAQTVRLPFCFGSGTLSDKIGRTRVIYPAAGAVVLACIGFALAKNNTQLLLLYILIMSAIGAFYPALQAFVGDHSPQGELRKNLSWFNVGWTVGGSICALSAGYLLAAGRLLPFAIGAVMAFIVIQLVFFWSRTPAARNSEAEDAVSQTVIGPGPLLLISRMGHFLSFFGLALVKNIFPKLGTDLGMSEGTIGVLVGTTLVGQAAGIFASSAGPWWRGKLWPQILAQAMALAAGLMAFTSRSPLAFGMAFLVQGIALGIAYTGALYYGMQARTNMGRNTGIHESLVAGGSIIGSLAGGASAQFISLRTPYLIFAGLSLSAIIASLFYWRLARDRKAS